MQRLLPLALFLSLSSSPVQDKSPAKNTIPTPTPTAIPISVEQFGAKCDGTTDDGPAFIAALGSGAAVTVPDNVTCVVASPISVSGVNLSLSSYGHGTVLFTGAGGLSWSSNEGTFFFNLHDLILHTTRQGGGAAITITNGNPNSIGVGSIAIYNNKFGSPGSRSYFETGILLSNSGQSNIYNNWLWGPAWTASNSSAAISIVANKATGAQPQSHMIYSNRISQWHFGIYISSIGSSAVEGVHIRDNQLGGSAYNIFVDNSHASYAPPGYIISDNEFNAFQGRAITLIKTSQFSISDNILYDNASGFDDVYIDNSLEGHVMGNFFANFEFPFAGSALSLKRHSILNIITNNIVASYRTGIYLDNTTDMNTIANNISAGGVTTFISNNAQGNTIIDTTPGHTTFH